ncbi:glycosyltransferase [Ferrimonas pelagia]|uniref:Glycosyltransferase 2-like domain-containing protein n=1 Tax=Ferrimonas pelagia TaxID=1177826 RepID=A0ABP9EHC4_9GAMM
MKEKVSVLLPVYNAGKYLECCLESLLGQTYKNIEIIALNDGSTDDSLELLKKYQERDSRIKVYSRENRGLIYTLNEGLKYCTGKYIARMDSDDICRPERFERQVEWLEHNLGCALVGSSYIFIDEQGNHIGHRDVLCKHADITAYFIIGNPMCHPSIMFNRDLIGDDLYYAETAETAEDFELWLRLSRKYSVFNLGERLLYYRINSQSITSTKKDSQSRMTRKLISEHFNSIGKLDVKNFVLSDKDITRFSYFRGVFYRACRSVRLFCLALADKDFKLLSIFKVIARYNAGAIKSAVRSKELDKVKSQN